MKPKKLLLILCLSLIPILIFAADGDPTEFGNSTVTTVWLGGSAGNINATGNISIKGYYFGQPLDGSIGSGVIWCSNIDNEGNVNLSINVLNITYPDLVVRLVRTDNVIKYCNISSDNVTMPENTHLVFYVDSSCTVKNTSFQNYVATDLSPGGIADIFNAYAVNGSVEMFKGATVKNKEDIKTRKVMFRTSHLRVHSGMNLDFNTVFPEIYQYSGEYLYVKTIVNTQARNSSNDSIRLVSHIGGSWDYVEQTGINLTHCDDTTDLIQCPTNKYRRYVIYTIGKDSTTQLYQLAPLTSDPTYNNVGECLDIVDNPISYTLPSEHEYLAVPTYVYCGLRDANTWDDGWIDIRGGVVTHGAVQDLTNYLSYDGLTQNWNQGDYNFTNTNSWFLGKINWSNIQNKLITSINNVYLYLSGSTLFFNESKLNSTIRSFNSSWNYTVDTTIGNCSVDQSCPNILYESELDTFSELDNQISDATLLNKTFADNTYLDNTDSQTLSFSGDNISISGGNEINISSIDTTIGNCSVAQSCSEILYDGNASDFLASDVSWGGDLGGTGSNPTVDDDSHSHTKSTITISGENITAGTINDDRLDFTLADAVADGGCTDCITETMVDDDGSGECASGKICTGGHDHPADEIIPANMNLNNYNISTVRCIVFDNGGKIGNCG